MELKNNNTQIDREYILGVPIDFGYSMSSFVNTIEKNLLSSIGNHICTTNPEFIMQAQKNEEFLDIIKSAAYSVPDGTGVILAKIYKDQISKYKSYPSIIKFFLFLLVGIKSVYLLFKDKDKYQRITGVDLVDEICKLSNEKGYSIFFLGGWPLDKRGHMLKVNVDVASLAAEHFRSKYPNVNIIGASSQFSYKPKDDNTSIEYIRHKMEDSNLNKLDFIFLCYPQYHQEKWIVRNASKIPVKVSVGAGRSFNYYTSYMQKPSQFVTKMHLEWIYTLLKEPWRAKRILQAFPVFPFKVFLKSLTNN